MTFSVAESYAIYMAAFIVSAICASLYARLAGQKLRYVFFILATATPAVLACFRGINVGTDYVNYITHFRDVSNVDSFLEALSVSGMAIKIEPGYNLLIYALSRLTDDVLLISFGVYFLSAVAVLAGLAFLLRKEYLFAAYLFYLCAYWLLGFNLVRQALAMSLIVLSISCVLNRQLLAFLVVVGLAVSIHRTALLVIPIYFMYSQKRGGTYLYDFCVLFGGILGLLFFEAMAAWMGSAGYLTNRGDGDDVSVSRALQATITLLPIVVGCFKYAKLPLLSFYLKILLAIIIINFISPMATVLSRLTFNFETFLVPMSLTVFAVMAAHKDSVRYLYLGYLVLYFVVYKFIYVYSNSGEVLPYGISSMW